MQRGDSEWRVQHDGAGQAEAAGAGLGSGECNTGRGKQFMLLTCAKSGQAEVHGASRTFGTSFA